MKNYKSLLVLLAISLGIISCEKEETENISENISQNESSDLVKFNSSVQSKILTSDISELDSKTELLINKFNRNRKNVYEKNSDPIPLEDIFILHQGAIDAIYSVPMDPNDSAEVVYRDIYVPVIKNENNTYLIEIDDYNIFYSQIVSQLNMEIDTNNGEYLSAIFFELKNISNMTATLSMALVIVTPPVSVITPFPSAAYHAFGKIGLCTNPWNGVKQNFDASDVISYHLKEYSRVTQQCPAGRTLIKRYIPSSKYDTKNGPFNWAVSQSFLTSNFLHSNSYICVGDDQDLVNNDFIWNTVLNNSISVPNLGKNAFVSNNPIIWTVSLFYSSSRYMDLPPPGPTNGFDNAHVGVFYYFTKSCI